MATSYLFQVPIEMGCHIFSAADLGLSTEDEIWIVGTVMIGGYDNESGPKGIRVAAQKGKIGKTR